jgi:hypothetical protein
MGVQLGKARAEGNGARVPHRCDAGQKHNRIPMNRQ